MTDADKELIQTFLNMLQIVVPLALSFIGVWKIILGYQDKRATAKERDHAMAMELQAANAKRAADDDAREDSKLQQAIDAVTLMASQLTRLMDIMQESQKQEAERLALRKQEFEQSHGDFVAISTEMKNQVVAMGELGSNLTKQLGTVAQENRDSYQKALDKKVDEEHEQSAALIAELKAKIAELKGKSETLEGYVVKDILPVLQDLHGKLNTLATKEDIEPVAAKLSELETRITALVKQDTPAPPSASAVVETHEAQPAPKTPDDPAKDKPHD